MTSLISVRLNEALVQEMRTKANAFAFVSDRVYT